MLRSIGGWRALGAATLAVASVVVLAGCGASGPGAATAGAETATASSTPKSAPVSTPAPVETPTPTAAISFNGFANIADANGYTAKVGYNFTGSSAESVVTYAPPGKTDLMVNGQWTVTAQNTTSGRQATLSVSLFWLALYDTSSPFCSPGVQEIPFNTTHLVTSATLGSGGTTNFIVTSPTQKSYCAVTIAIASTPKTVNLSVDGATALSYDGLNGATAATGALRIGEFPESNPPTSTFDQPLGYAVAAIDHSNQMDTWLPTGGCTVGVSNNFSGASSIVVGQVGSSNLLCS